MDQPNAAPGAPAPEAVPAPTPPAAAPSAGTQYAGFWTRVVACVIDGLVSSVLAGVFFIPAAFLDSLGVIATLNLIGGLVVLAWTIYNHLYLVKKDGATVGKKAMKVRVQMDDGSEMTWGTVLLREIVGKAVSEAIASIGFLMVAFTAKKQGLHDMISKTVVVKR